MMCKLPAACWLVSLCLFLITKGKGNFVHLLVILVGLISSVLVLLGL